MPAAVHQIRSGQSERRTAFASVFAWASVIVFGIGMECLMSSERQSERRTEFASVFAWASVTVFGIGIEKW